MAVVHFCGNTASAHVVTYKKPSAWILGMAIARVCYEGQAA